jgi:hypothetical protein
VPERRRTGNPEESQEAAADEETAEADESHYPRVPLDFSSSLLFSDAAFPRLILFSRQGRRSECVMICSVQVKKEKREYPTFGVDKDILLLLLLFLACQPWTNKMEEKHVAAHANNSP